MKKTYYPWKNYSMKVRLYPNAGQVQKFDDILHGVHVFCNMVYHDVQESFLYTNEEADRETGEPIHWLDIGKAKKELDKYREQNSCIKKVPASALSNQKKSCLDDVAKQYQVFKEEDKKFHPLPVEKVEHNFYNKVTKRSSYTCQECFRKVKKTENNNVFWFNFTNVGYVKIRGWNKNIRFGDGAKYNFLEYAEANPEKRIYVTVKKDKCGDYWAIFGFSHGVKGKKETGFFTYVPFVEEPEDGHIVGVDAGQTDLAITSDGKKYANPKYAEGSKEKNAFYERKMSKAQGFSNVEFREAYKKDKTLKPSKNAEKWKLKQAKLSRRTARRRKNAWDNVTSDIVKNSSTIYIESLKVKDMMNRDKKKEELGTRKKAARSNGRMSDAAMSMGLTMLQYKAVGYSRRIKEIGTTRSTGVCPKCGYVTPPLSKKIRAWVCPNCDSEWDRDIAAAIVIRQKGIALDAVS